MSTGASDRRVSSSARAAWGTAVVSLGLAAVYLGCTLTGGWDIWWHMLVGRVTVQEGASLATDVFSHTMAGAAWLYKDLVADVVLFAGHDFLGYFWFAILKALAVCSVAVGVHFSMPRGYRRPVISVLVAGLAIVAVQYRLVERPVLFSLALFPLLFALLLRVRSIGREATVRGLAARWMPVVALSWVWILLHRGGLVGLGLILAFALEAWAGRIWGARMSRLFPPRSTVEAVVASVAFITAVGLSSANPCGYHLHASSLAVAGSEALRAYITDWRPIGPVELVLDFPVTLLVALAALAFSGHAILRKGDRDEPVMGLLFPGLILFFGAASLLDSVRWIPYLSITSCVALGLGLCLAADGIASRVPGIVLRARGWSLLAGLGVLGLIILNNDFGTGVGPMEDRYPDGAISFAREQGLSGNVINSFHLGGYILWEMWPDVRVSLDGRNDLVYPPDVLAEGMKSQKDPALFERIQEAAKADWVIASNIPGHLSHTFLFRDPDWMMVYWSDPAVIYARRGAHSELEGLEYVYIDPASVDGSVVETFFNHRSDSVAIAQLWKEIDGMIKLSPSSVRSNVALALYYHYLGPSFYSKRDDVIRMLDEDLQAPPGLTKELDNKLSAKRP